MIAERVRWQMDAAPVLEQLRLKGREPKHQFELDVIARRPPDDEVVDDVLRALQDLGTERQIGMALGPIPITAIWSYWERKGRDAASVEILTAATLEGDRVYLAERAKEKS